MIFKNSNLYSSKKRYSPDFFFNEKGVSFFYTYIRKNASTSFKLLFQALYPEACPGTLPEIGCMIKHAQVNDLEPKEIDLHFATKLFIYRDPIDRVFSTYKNKLIQQDGAADLLKRLEKVVGRDPSLLTFDEFVHEYVVLLETERWEEVDSHLYPQVWHLLPITYNKVIRMDNVYKEMRELLSEELCDKVFKEPSNSTTKGSTPLAFCDPDCPAIYFRKKYARAKALPTLQQVLTPATEARLRDIYAEDYRMIAEVEGQSLNEKLSLLDDYPIFYLNSDDDSASQSLSMNEGMQTPEQALGLDFSLPEDVPKH